MWRPIAMLLLAALPRLAAAQHASPPAVVGWIAGALATSNPPGQHMDGTDLGWTFEHRGQLFILFGDSWYSGTVCNGALENDDAQGTLPLGPPVGAPHISFFTRADAPLEFDGIRIYRNGESLPMRSLQVPVAGFSDGNDAFAVFSREEYVPCVRAAPDEPATCPVAAGAATDGFTCAATLGTCVPPIASLLCDTTTKSGCLFFQRCTASTDGYCVDHTSSQYIGSTASEPFAAVNRVDIGVQRPADPVAYDSIAVWNTNKFLNVTARTVAAFTGKMAGSDYRPGHAAVLMWGRPGFWAERGREAQVYLMTHALPFPTDAEGQRRFEPQYFAGIDPLTGEPRWTSTQSEAQALAMDGIAGGSPHEPLPIPDQMGISWVPEPVNKWVMLYGGDAPDLYLVDPKKARPDPAGSIRIRFADHPWGPWTVAKPHLSPGSPAVPGDPYGPGGFMYHTNCHSQGDAKCAPNTVVSCATGGYVDIGRLYAPNIIDVYTHPDGTGGVTIYWNVSTFNPYGVLLMKTTIRPGAACVGDCDGDGQITVNELVTLVNIALGTQPSACVNGVPSDREVDIALIVRAVNSALSACAD